MIVSPNDYLICLPQYAIAAVSLLVLLLSLLIFFRKSMRFHRKRVAHFEQARKRMAKKSRSRSLGRSSSSEGEAAEGRKSGGGGNAIDRKTVLDAIDMAKLQRHAGGSTRHRLSRNHDLHSWRQHHGNGHAHGGEIERRRYSESGPGKICEYDEPISRCFNEIFINRLFFTYRQMMNAFERKDRTNQFEECAVEEEEEDAIGEKHMVTMDFADAMAQQQLQQQEEGKDSGREGRLKGGDGDGDSNGSIDIEMRDMRPMDTHQQDVGAERAVSQTTTPISRTSSRHFNRQQSLIVTVPPKSQFTPEYVRLQNERFVTTNTIVPKALRRQILKEMLVSERLYWFDMPHYQVKKRKTLRNSIIFVALTLYLCLTFTCLSLFVVHHDNALAVAIVGGVASLLPLTMTIIYVNSLISHNVCYALTDKRAIFCRRRGIIWDKFSTASYPYSKMQGIYCQNEIKMSKFNAYIGDVLFCRDEVAEKRANAFGWKTDASTNAALVGFRSIYQLYDVQKLLLYKFIANQLEEEKNPPAGPLDEDGEWAINLGNEDQDKLMAFDV